MNTRYNCPGAICLAAAGLLAASVAHAQTAGDITIRFGGSHVNPNASNGQVRPDLAPGGGLDIKNASQISGGVTYFFSPNLALDVPIAPAFRHDLVGTGTLAPAGKLGEVSNLPIQAILQYRFGQSSDTLRPFVGLGATYVVVTSAKTAGPLTPLSLDLDNSLGAAVQIGASWALTPQWSIEAAAIKSSLSVKGSLSSGQTLSIKLKPTVLSLSAVYKFGS
jgi:outer membrane protein